MQAKFLIGLFISLCFPFTGMTQTLKFLPKGNPKVQTARKIYETFKPFLENDANGKLPELAVIEKHFVPKPASYHAGKHQIFIEEKALDVCFAMGKDSLTAIAILMAHEAMHFLKKHSGENSYACAFTEAETPIDLQKEKQETEADLWGLFTTYLAGYEVAAVTPALLEAIYKNYNLPADLPGYPSLKTRKAIFNKALEKVEDLTALYEAGNYLTAIGEYDKAAACYRTILQDYQSQEMYNNLGTALASAAVSVMNDPPVYPFQTDLRSKLYRRQPPFGFQPEDVKNYWLQEAETAFAAALEIKKDYFPAHLNQACVFTMQGRYEEAAPTLKTARRLASLSKPEQENLGIVEALLAWYGGNKGLARHTLSRMDNFIATQNLRWMQGEPQAQKTELPFPAPIDRLCNELPTSNWKGADTVSLTSGMVSGLQYELLYRESGCNRAFSIARKNYETSDRVYVLCTRQKDQRTLKGIGIGSPASTLPESYPGKAWQEVSAVNKSFRVCREVGLLLLLNSQETVEEWGVFKILSK